MLTIATTVFFTLALTGALLTIVMMFHTYQDRIKAVIIAELGKKALQLPAPSPRYRTHMNKPYAATRRFPHQPVPLPVAA